MSTSPGFVARVQRRQNRVNALKACGFVLLSIILWPLSYWIFKLLVIIPCFLCGWSVSATVTSAIAWVCLALLAVEGARYGRVFDIMSGAGTWYMRSLTGTEQEALVTRRIFGYSWIISQTLFSAPRSTVKAMKALRAIVVFGPEELADAERVFADLAPTRRWVPLTQNQDHGGVVFKLYKLGLIMTRFEGGVAEIKVPPRFVESPEAAPK